MKNIKETNIVKIIKGLVKEENFVECFFKPQKSIRIKIVIEYVVDDRRKLAYLITSKNACSSIKASFTRVRPKQERLIHKFMADNGFIQKTLENEQKDYFKFTFVRNPFDRLISSYINKYKQEIFPWEKFYFEQYLDGYLVNSKDFDDYVRKVCLIPEFMMERHILPQYLVIYDENNKPRVDYIGKYENLEEEFKPIQEKYNLYQLPHYNQSNKNNYRDYYTLETAKMVYKKYKKDFELFGYNESYKELVEYLKTKKKNQQ